MRLTHEPLPLATTFEFRISVGASSAHANTLVRIEHDGITGLGEASPSHYYGENSRLVEAALDTWAPHLGEDPWALEAIESRLWGVLRGHGAARAGLDMALHDWIGKRVGLPIWKLHGLPSGRGGVVLKRKGSRNKAKGSREESTPFALRPSPFALRGGLCVPVIDDKVSNHERVIG